MVVYLDVLFMINLIMNYIILIITASALGIYAKRYRIFISALLGAIYAVFIFFSYFQFIYTAVFKIVVGIVLCVVAFGKKDIIKSFLMFFLVSFGLAGITMGIFYFTKNSSYMVASGVYYADISINILISALIICYILLGGVFKGVFKNRENITEIYIKILSKKIKVYAFCDTGNSLIDYVTGKPVIIVESEEILKILPYEYRFIGLKNPVEVMEFSAKIENPLKLRVINYRAVGVDNAMIIVLKPDEVLDKKGKKIDALIGISPNKLNICGAKAIIGG